MVSGQSFRMQSPPRDGFSEVKESSFVNPGQCEDHLDASTLCSDATTENHQDASKQLVLYDSKANDSGQDIVVSNGMHTSPFLRSPLSYSNRLLPSIGAFTVQCATCFKWRLIPSKEIYEQIRETILQEPFVCLRAREWKPNVSCDDPPDISQDGSRLWAIDKPNIAKPPEGWERLLRIRGEGGTRFADVYYAAPCGKRMRSMVEIERYLSEHPDQIRAGVTLSRFSFQIPKPLQENYVKKRPQRPANPSADGAMGPQMPLEPHEVNPLAWAPPASPVVLNISGLSGPCFSSPSHDPTTDYPGGAEETPSKKRRKKEVSKPRGEICRSSVCDQATEDYKEVASASPCEL